MIYEYAFGFWSLAVERSQHRRFWRGIKTKVALQLICKWRGSTAFEGVAMIHQPDIYKVWRLMIGNAFYDWAYDKL